MGRGISALVFCALALGLTVHRAWADETTQPTSITEVAASREFTVGAGGLAITATKAERAAAERIESALDQPLKTPLDFVDTPLNSVLQVIAEEYDLPIQFDQGALEASAVSPDIEVSVNLRNISLRSALELMLRQQEGMTYTVDHEVLLITSKDAAAADMEVRIYRIDDLWDLARNEPANGPDSSAPFFTPLTKVIVNAVAPDSWAENGRGEGDVYQLPPGILVVYQSKHVHREIEQFLATVRRCKAAIEGGDTEQAAENPFAVR